MSTFHCKQCGRAIFHAREIIERVNLWDLQDYQAECYAVREIIDLAGLKRFDVSLHEGWYCCRFIVMRMVVDKFGTGSTLLVYVDSVVEVAEGATPPRIKDTRGQIKLTSRDYDALIQAPAQRDKLLLVKYGAIWCPPCRLMDTVFARITSSGSLADVVFFEVDTDEEQELAGRWSNQSIPFCLFYYAGVKLNLTSQTLPIVDGGLIGGLSETHVRALCGHVLDAARSGQTTIAV